QGRGSKHARLCAAADGQVSPLAQGRGSKLLRVVLALVVVTSPPAQGRGSKRRTFRASSASSFRPSRRGADRNAKLESCFATAKVAPRAGARIETARASATSGVFTSPLAQGRRSKRAAGYGSDPG